MFSNEVHPSPSSSHSLSLAQTLTHTHTPTDAYASAYCMRFDHFTGPHARTFLPYSTKSEGTVLYRDTVQY